MLVRCSGEPVNLWIMSFCVQGGRRGARGQPLQKMAFRSQHELISQPGNISQPLCQFRKHPFCLACLVHPCPPCSPIFLFGRASTSLVARLEGQGTFWVVTLLEVRTVHSFFSFLGVYLKIRVTLVFFKALRPSTIHLVHAFLQHD